jgi:hypothetical protein
VAAWKPTPIIISANGDMNVRLLPHADRRMESLLKFPKDKVPRETLATVFSHGQR